MTDAYYGIPLNILYKHRTFRFFGIFLFFILGLENYVIFGILLHLFSEESGIIELLLPYGKKCYEATLTFAILMLL